MAYKGKRSNKKFNPKFNKSIHNNHNQQESELEREKREKKEYNQKYAEEEIIKTGMIFSGNINSGDIIYVEKIAEQLINAFYQHYMEYKNLTPVDLLNICESFFIGDALIWARFDFFAKFDVHDYCLKVVDAKYFGKEPDFSEVDIEAYKAYSPKILIKEFLERFKPRHHACLVIDKIREIKQGSLNLDRFRLTFFDHVSLISNEDLEQEWVREMLVDVFQENLNFEHQYIASTFKSLEDIKHKYKTR
ncbi:uncharacterized protein KGF55_002843 [Candida pseudojiufengensis]|uniref:uncharacterized protein n=1 Tax=Candida pseudojiufengensis TaxID=497109 RepID=UPI002224A10F|nr:uncharacterized protein KGF55_002843 [Candida pseudojiufengensis]KAI5963051.1 hypothetical protein KGF55_002843 [Candida pseudojiufengensis]